MRKKLLSIILAVAMLACMIPMGMVTVSAEDNVDWFYITNNNTDAAKNVTFKKNSSSTLVNIWYTDTPSVASSWVALELTSSSKTLSFPAGKTYYFKGNHETFNSSKYLTISFPNTTDGFKVGGDVTTLISATSQTATDCGNVLDLTSYGEYTFNKLFNRNDYSFDISDLKLPSTILIKYCYLDMFNGCKKLTEVPANLLPATTLAEGCYKQMFFNCGSLTKAPDLPARELVKSCYYSMFDNCYSLSSLRVNFKDWGSLITTSSTNNATYKLLPANLNKGVTLDFCCPYSVNDHGVNISNFIAVAIFPFVRITPVSHIETPSESNGWHFIIPFDEENGAMMGRQGKITEGGGISEQIGRFIIPLTQKQLDGIDSQLVIVGGDERQKEFTVNVDCAYTWFYNGGEKVEAEGMKNAKGEDVAAFVIVDCDNEGNPITGYGHYCFYNGTVTEENFLFDAMYEAPSLTVAELLAKSATAFPTDAQGVIPTNAWNNNTNLDKKYGAYVWNYDKSSTAYDDYTILSLNNRDVSTNRAVKKIDENTYMLVDPYPNEITDSWKCVPLVFRLTNGVLTKIEYDGCVFTPEA